MNGSEMDGLAYASDTLEARLEAIVRGTPELAQLLETLQALELPDAWIVSGALYQTVWNVLTKRPRDHGLKDYDVIYYDASDLSYEGEDARIKALNAALPTLAGKLELRNQARVHLWYESRFGQSYPALGSATQSLDFYAAKTHAVAVRLNTDGALEIHAPFGLELIFDMCLEPNMALDNSRTYAEKGERMRKLWPELTIIPWPDDCVTFPEVKPQHA